MRTTEEIRDSIIKQLFHSDAPVAQVETIEAFLGIIRHTNPDGQLVCRIVFSRETTVGIAQELIKYAWRSIRQSFIGLKPPTVGERRERTAKTAYPPSKSTVIKAQWVTVVDKDGAK